MPMQRWWSPYYVQGYASKQLNVLRTAYRGLFTRPVNKTTSARWSMMKKRKGWSAMKDLMCSTKAHWSICSTAVAAAASDPSSFTSTTAFTQSTGRILKKPNRCPCWDDGHLIMCKTKQVSNWTSCELHRITSGQSNSTTSKSPFQNSSCIHANPYSSQIHKISSNRKYKTENSYTRLKQIFKELVPLILPLLKKKYFKCLQLGHASIVDPSSGCINTVFVSKNYFQID